MSIIKTKTAKLNNLNFYPLEVVSRYREPQVVDNFANLFILGPSFTNIDVKIVHQIKRIKNDYSRAYKQLSQWFLHSSEGADSSCMTIGAYYK